MTEPKVRPSDTFVQEMDDWRREKAYLEQESLYERRPRPVS